MPDFEERKDVSSPWSSGPQPFRIYTCQILHAVARKVRVSELVDWGEVAEATDGYSGADLQALVYNAHLEVIHASIAAAPPMDSPSSRGDDTPIEYTTFGGPEETAVKSKAEEMALQTRVRIYVPLGTQP